MPNTVNVAVVGLGSIGQAVARLLLETPHVKVVGAADPSPTTGGKDLGTALGLPRRLRIKVDTGPSSRSVMLRFPRRATNPWRTRSIASSRRDTRNLD